MTSGGNNFIDFPHRGCQLESRGFTPLGGLHKSVVLFFFWIF